MAPRCLSVLHSVRVPTALAAVAVAFALGATTQHLREAHADTAPPVAATVYVPSGGLMFRALDGRPLARIGRDEGGGVVEIFDARGDVAQRVSAGSAPPALRRGASSFPSDDPFDTRPAEIASRKPGPGF